MDIFCQLTWSLVIVILVSSLIIFNSCGSGKASCLKWAAKMLSCTPVKVVRCLFFLGGCSSSVNDRKKQVHAKFTQNWRSLIYSPSSGWGLTSTGFFAGNSSQELPLEVDRPHDDTIFLLDRESFVSLESDGACAAADPDFADVCSLLLWSSHLSASATDKLLKWRAM